MPELLLTTYFSLFQVIKHFFMIYYVKNNEERCLVSSFDQIREGREVIALPTNDESTTIKYFMKFDPLGIGEGWNMPAAEAVS